jgi:phosphoglycerate kinase
MQNLDLSGKRALLRVDFNVPLDSNFEVTDDTRILSAVPTIKYILEQGAAVILMSHFGRPLKKLKSDGTIDKKKFSLKHIIPALEAHLGISVSFAEDCLGDATKGLSQKLQPGQVLLLENTRFHPGEEKGDEQMAKELASLGDVYINDAFGTAHRAHASTAVMAKFFDKSHKSFGFLMESELKGAEKVLNNPDRPLTAIVGGAKVSDKILLIEKLAAIADHLIIGGGMAYTFMRAKDGKTGNSLVEEDRIDLAKSLLENKSLKAQIHLPTDSKIADSFSNDAATKNCDNMSIPEGWMGLDIGPEAISTFKKIILDSKTILWNGPMGVFEMSNFAEGTRSIALAVAEATKTGAYSLIGGGDSVAAVNQLDLAESISFVSTGGGAMLELLEGKVLPGVQAILD